MISVRFVYRITDAVTGEKRNISSVIAGVVLAEGDQEPVLLKDWEVLQRLNALAVASGFTDLSSFRCGGRIIREPWPHPYGAQEPYLTASQHHVAGLK